MWKTSISELSLHTTENLINQLWIWGKNYPKPKCSMIQRKYQRAFGIWTRGHEYETLPAEAELLHWGRGDIKDFRKGDSWIHWRATVLSGLMVFCLSTWMHKMMKCEDSHPLHISHNCLHTTNNTKGRISFVFTLVIWFWHCL